MYVKRASAPPRQPVDVRDRCTRLDLGAVPDRNTPDAMWLAALYRTIRFGGQLAIEPLGGEPVKLEIRVSPAEGGAFYTHIEDVTRKGV